MAKLFQWAENEQMNCTEELLTINTYSYTVCSFKLITKDQLTNRCLSLHYWEERKPNIIIS